MNDNPYTPGKWSEAEVLSALLGNGFAGDDYFGTPKKTSVANAKRIVACVNACNEIDNLDQLQNHCLFDAHRDTLMWVLGSKLTTKIGFKQVFTPLQIEYIRKAFETMPK